MAIKIINDLLSKMKLQRVAFCTKTTSTNKETGKKTTKMVDQFLSCGAVVTEMEWKGGMGEGMKKQQYLVLAVPFNAAENTVIIHDKDDKPCGGYYRLMNLSNDCDGKVTVHTSKRFNAQVVCAPEWRGIGDYPVYRKQYEHLKAIAELEEKKRKLIAEMQEKMDALHAKTSLPVWTS